MCRGTFKYGGAIFNYDLFSGTLTIGVRDNRNDYLCDIDNISCYDQEINFPRSSFETVIIENGITHIDVEAFEYFTNLRSVTIPESVTYIGAGAFCDCKRLTDIKIPDDVKTIGSAVFSGCTGLKTIHYKAGADFTEKLCIGNNAELIAR